MHKYQLYINGEFVDSRSKLTFDSISPFDQEIVACVASRLRAGTVWINEWHLISERSPFGGYKQSGIGREFGIEGLKEYTETKHLHIDELGSREKKPWYDVVVPK
jgi:acyl-CoA reductase-like NAD-dependent aldehyde dehydrogenase